MNSLNRKETTELIAKLKEIELEISGERGSFILYAMLIRKSGVGNWDILMAADWLHYTNRMEFAEYVANLWRNRLTEKQMVNLNMLLFGEDDWKGIEDALEEVTPVLHGEERIHNINFLGQEIEKGVVITARPKAVAA